MSTFVQRRAARTRRWAAEDDAAFLDTLGYGFRFAAGVPLAAAQAQMRAQRIDPAQFEFRLNRPSDEWCAFARRVDAQGRGPELRLWVIRDVEYLVAYYRADARYRGAVRENFLGARNLTAWPRI